MDDNVAFVDFPATAYPIHIQMFYVANDELAWETTLHGPGALEVPGQAVLKGKVWPRVTYGDGVVEERRPDGATET